MDKRRFYYLLPMTFLMIVAVAGWFATDYLGNKARHETIAENRASLLSVSTYLSSTLTNLEGAVRSLAGSPWIASALMSKKERDIENANSVLDRYNSALKASVSYLMDAGGMTVASSNRKDPDSFVGKSYLFRPYFKEAARGLAGRYFALGETSGKRGFYVSYPVRDRSGKVLGVAAMKKDLDSVESFFKRYAFCFLINPDGVIFLSSSPAMAMKSLYPLDKAVQERLIASRQFGDKPLETVFLKKDFAHDTEVTFEGQDYFVSREVIDSDGWSIVLLTSTDLIRIYKLTGILATISVCFMIMILSGIIYFTGRAKEIIRQREEDKLMLLYAAGEGIFGLDAAGRVTFINPAALRMLGFAEEEVLGKNAHGLIHHSRNDGSSYPAQECPMCFSRARDADSQVANEVLWRKDGSNFSAECSSMPIIRDGTVMGAVVTFKDITERKRLEELLQNSEEKHRLLFDSAGDAILVVGKEARILAANPLACERLGYSHAELLSMTVDQMDSPAESIRVPDRIGRVMEHGHFTFETVQKRKDGLFIPTEVSARRITWDGQSAILSICRDITERKRLEEALINDQLRLTAVLDSIDALVYAADFNSYEILFLNKFGRDEWGEAVGKRCWETLQKDLKGPCEFCTNNRLLSGSGEPTGVYRWEFQNTKNGRWYYCRDQAIKWIDGRLVRLEIATDITGHKLLEERLSESEEKFKAIFDSAGDGILLADPANKKFLQGNAAMCSMLGYTKEEIRGLTVYDIHPPEDVPRILDEFEKQARGEKVVAENLPVLRKDGSTFYADVSSTLITAGGVQYLTGIFRDITERKQVEEMILNERNKFLTLSEGAPFGVVLIDKEGKFIYINPKFKELFGYDMEDVPDGRTWFKKAYPDREYRRTVISAWAEDLERAEVGQKRPRIFKVRCKDDTEKIINFIPVQLETGENMMSCDDITEQKRLEQQLHTMSLTDELTGLYNRRGFITLSGQQLKIAERARKGLLLFFADLDRMKHINDTLGHQAGDMALVEVAAVLKEVFRESDIIGRMGGDEFAVLAIDAADEARETLTDRLRNAIDNCNRREGRKYQLSLSIGTARYDPEEPSTLDGLMIQADTLMYEEKRSKQH